MREGSVHSDPRRMRLRRCCLRGCQWAVARRAKRIASTGLCLGRTLRPVRPHGCGGAVLGSPVPLGPNVTPVPCGTAVGLLSALPQRRAVLGGVVGQPRTGPGVGSAIWHAARKEAVASIRPGLGQHRPAYGQFSPEFGQMSPARFFLGRSPARLSMCWFAVRGHTALPRSRLARFPKQNPLARCARTITSLVFPNLNFADSMCVRGGAPISSCQVC